MHNREEAGLPIQRPTRQDLRDTRIPMTDTIQSYSAWAQPSAGARTGNNTRNQDDEKSDEDGTKGLGRPEEPRDVETIDLRQQDHAVVMTTTITGRTDPTDPIDLTGDGTAMSHEETATIEDPAQTQQAPVTTGEGGESIVHTSRLTEDVVLVDTTPMVGWVDPNGGLWSKTPTEPELGQDSTTIPAMSAMLNTVQHINVTIHTGNGDHEQPGAKVSEEVEERVETGVSEEMEEAADTEGERATEHEKPAEATSTKGTGEVTIRMTDLMDMFRKLARDEMARERLRLEDARNGGNQGSGKGSGSQPTGIETSGQLSNITTGGQSPVAETEGQSMNILTDDNEAATDSIKVSHA